MRPRPSTSAAGAMRPGSCSQRPLANERERTECARVLICLGTSGQVFKVGTKRKEHPPILRRVKTKPRTRRARKCRGEELQKQSGKPGRRRRPPESLHGTRMQRRRVGSGPRGKLPQGLKPGWHKNQAARTVFRGLNTILRQAAAGS